MSLAEKEKKNMDYWQIPLMLIASQSLAQIKGKLVSPADSAEVGTFLWRTFGVIVFPVYKKKRLFEWMEG